MSIYTLSKCMSRCCEPDKLKTYYANVMLKFTQQNDKKVAVDEDGKIDAVYKKIASENHYFFTWIDLMSREPSSFEKVKIPIDEESDEEELFLKVCSNTHGDKNLIVYSSQIDWSCAHHEEDNIIYYNGVLLRVLDRDEALEELKDQRIEISRAIIASEGSTVKGAKIGG